MINYALPDNSYAAIHAAYAYWSASHKCQALADFFGSLLIGCFYILLRCAMYCMIALAMTYRSIGI